MVYLLVAVSAEVLGRATLVTWMAAASRKADDFAPTARVGDSCDVYIIIEGQSIHGRHGIVHRYEIRPRGRHAYMCVKEPYVLTTKLP